MYCQHCGSALPDGTRFCTACGSAQQHPPQSVAYGSPQPLVGFSTRISDPAFARYTRRSNWWAVIFATVLAIVAVAGFAIAGERGVEGMSNPQALYIGLGVGGMFLAIAFFQVLGRARSTTWDGTVIDKTITKRRHEVGSGDDSRWEDYLEYAVIIRADSGKTQRLTAKNDDTVYNYYRIGDRVRHHAGLNSYEKYDKRGDTIVFCLACGSLNDIQGDVCARCKCPLPK
ncbi:MAG TPA: zinc-ribbon domain-containing protein [Anaerolineae bacterium]|nr:zinc-ribbon domain-containing protein [Anaerolineae bacterium]HOQ99558.1 zinc-ribbon domain-containing protein [Anaerolineae bacterium]HPL27933.1 zinc-ribbon domain-containing protein [Anaerolineae bacterium]